MPSLTDQAREARKQAYAPYSGYKVGAAVQSEDGRTFTGCNVENISYGLTICAERAAIFKMISEGARQISEIAIVTPDGNTPCGACLQVLAEFSPSDLRVTCLAETGEVRNYTLAELLPHGFRSNAIPRTEPPAL